MTLLGRIAKCVLLPVVTLGLSGCWDFSDNYPSKEAGREAVRNLPLEEIFLKAEADIGRDGDTDKIIVGKVKGKDRCATYFLENTGDDYKPRRLNELAMYPDGEEWSGHDLDNNGEFDVEVLISDYNKRKKPLLELKVAGETYKTHLGKKK